MGGSPTIIEQGEGSWALEVYKIRFEGGKGSTIVLRAIKSDHPGGRGDFFKG